MTSIYKNRRPVFHSLSRIRNFHHLALTSIGSSGPTITKAANHLYQDEMESFGRGPAVHYT